MIVTIVTDTKGNQALYCQGELQEGGCPLPAADALDAVAEYMHGSIHSWFSVKRLKVSYLVTEWPDKLEDL